MDENITAGAVQPQIEGPPLTDREKGVFQLVAQGYRNKEIAKKLHVDEQTVKNRLRRIFEKLGVNSRLELAVYAIRHGLAKKRVTKL